MSEYDLKENQLLPQQFCVVDRLIGEEPKVVICNDFIEACATQLGLLVGIEPEMAKPMLAREDIETIIKNFETMGRDRVANDEKEVYIFWMPGRSDIRHGK